MKVNELTPKEKEIIIGKGTEPPFSGKYDDFFKEGEYVCKQCSTPLFDSKAKFDAGCGWPAFDDFYPNAVEELLDRDGMRTEILCKRCGGHLGHVFRGEGFTKKDTRHCVNSLSIRFVSKTEYSKESES